MRRDRVDTRGILTLRNEFLALSPLSHPNLARVYDFEVDLASQDYFFTCEFVDGLQLLKAAKDFRVARPGDFARLVAMLVQISRALEFIHSRGLVHGDIKPENILITGSLVEPGGGPVTDRDPPLVKMIDFGLTKRERGFGGKRIIGTAYYIAPETILGSQIDRRTDLYSLGVLLYHIATRKLPFSGDSNLGILRAHIEKTPVPPHEVEPSVPAELSRIILRLMEKQPTKRYSTALEIIEELNRSFGANAPLETPETLRSYVDSGSFIGRDPQLRELKGLFESICPPEASTDEEDEQDLAAPSRTDDSDPNGDGIERVLAADQAPLPSGRMILVRGEVGIGKHRLLSEFRRFAQTRGVHFIEIDCAVAREGARRSFTELVRAQVSVLVARAPEEAPDPVRLEAFLDTLERSSSSPLLLRPAVDGLAKKTLALSVSTPLVLAFEGIHAADSVLLEFLRATISRIAEGRANDARILVVATAIDEDPEDSLLRPMLRTGSFRNAIREVHLSRFAPADVEKSVGSMLGVSPGGSVARLPEAVLRAVVEESDGNPGKVGELLRHLVGAGAVRRTLHGWVADPELDTSSLPRHVREETRERIAGLDPNARVLANAFAILGDHTEIEVAARLAGIPPGKIIDAVLALKRARIIREEAEADHGSVYSFVHSSVAALLYQEVSESSRPGLHNLAGGILEAFFEGRGQGDPCRLAFHFFRAENVRAALRYGLEAGRAHAERMELSRAIEVYSSVIAILPPSDPKAIATVEDALIDLHFRRGDIRLTADLLRGLSDWKGAPAADSQSPPAPPLLPFSGDPRRRAGHLVRLAEALSRLGEFRDGVACLNEAFRLTKGLSDNQAHFALLLGFADLFQRRGKFGDSIRYCERAREWEASIADLDLRVRRQLLLAENYYRLDQKELAARHCQQGLELLGSSARFENLGGTLFNLGRFHLYRGRFPKARRAFQQALRVAERTECLDSQGHALAELGVVALSEQKWHDALGFLQSAVPAFQRTGNQVALTEALNLRAEAHRALGSYQEAQSDLQAALRGNAAMGCVHLASESCLVSARVAIDRGQPNHVEGYLFEAERYKEG